MTVWLAYGQAQINASSSVDNPTSSQNGLAGEVSGLPYTVPADCELVLETYGVEGYDQAGIVVIFPWIGATLSNNSQCLPSAAADSQTMQLSNLNFRIPSGKIVNIRLQNGQSAGGNPVCGWFVQGRLERVGS